MDELTDLTLLTPEIRIKRDWRSAIISGGLIAAIVSGFIFAYSTWYNVPVLTYEVLPAYPVTPNEQIVAVIVRNEGRASATDVRIVIQATSEISILPTLIQEQTQITLQNTTVIATLPRLPPSTQISLFVRVQSGAASPITDVYVSSLQGLGIQRSRTTTEDPFSIIIDVFAALGFIFTLAIIGSTISSRRKKRLAKG